MVKRTADRLGIEHVVKEPKHHHSSRVINNRYLGKSSHVSIAI